MTNKQAKKAKPMAKSTLTTKTPVPIVSVLSDEINAAIASKIIPTTPAPEVATRIKTKLMQAVQAEMHLFVFANQGEWKTVHEGVQIKLLHKVGETKSFLVKMAAHTSIPGHPHNHDEESFVLDGSVTLEGVLCHAGDYHYAQAGSRHQKIHTAQGCTLLIKSL
jgi:quercetin dioxygenase-like cupin family protein